MSEQSTPASQPEAPAGKAEISFDDFVKLDLRVATVTHAEPHPNADKLLKLQVDDDGAWPRRWVARSAH